MLSIRTERCNSHLHETKNFQSEKSTSSPTFVSSSFSNLSLKFLVVIYFHSLPANGESFTRNSICNVGLSIAIEGKGSTFHVQTVSHTKISGIHAIVIISPSFTTMPSSGTLSPFNNVAKAGKRHEYLGFAVRTFTQQPRHT